LGVSELKKTEAGKKEFEKLLRKSLKNKIE